MKTSFSEPRECYAIVWCNHEDEIPRYQQSHCAYRVIGWDVLHYAENAGAKAEAWPIMLNVQRGQTEFYGSTISLVVYCSAEEADSERERLDQTFKLGMYAEE